MSPKGAASHFADVFVTVPAGDNSGYVNAIRATLGNMTST